MPIQTAEPEEAGTWRVFGKDPENRKPIRFKIRPIDPDTHEQIVNEELLVGRKKRSLANMSAMESAARAKAISRRRAHLSLVDSENFAIRFVGTRSQNMAPEVAAAGLTMAADGVVEFAGKWTEGAKNLVFKLMPHVVDFVNEKASEISAEEEADEEDTVAAFR